MAETVHSFVTTYGYSDILGSQACVLTVIPSLGEKSKFYLHVTD